MTRIRRLAPTPRLVALLVAVLLALVPVAHARATAAAPARTDPCSVRGSYTSGLLEATFYRMGVGHDDDMDIVAGSVQLTPTDLVATIKVTKLGELPTLYWGDEFELQLRDQVTRGLVTAGYYRTRSGGGAYLNTPRSARPAETGDSVSNNFYSQARTTMQTTFDLPSSTVTMAIPRSEIETGFGRPMSRLRLTTMAVATYERDPAGFSYQADYGQLGSGTTVILPKDCDAWLARHSGPKPPAQTPCEWSAVDQVNDEISREGTTTPVRNDDLDLAAVSGRLTRDALVTTLRIARLQDRPVDSTGDDFSVTASVRGKAAVFESVRDVAGTSYVATGGAKPTAVFDKAASTVTVTIPRAELAKAFGLSSINGVTLSRLGARTHWSYGPVGTTGIADGLEIGLGFLQVPSCDRYLASHR